MLPARLPVPAVIGALVGVFGLVTAIARVGDWAGKQETRAQQEDEQQAEQAKVLAKQDDVLDAQRVELARDSELLDQRRADLDEVRAQLRELREREEHEDG